MNFRFHRGGFKESMGTREPVRMIAELLGRIANEQQTPVRPITIAPYGFDKRIGAETFIVTTPPYGVAGFIDDAPDVHTA